MISPNFLDSPEKKSSFHNSSVKRPTNESARSTPKTPPTSPCATSSAPPPPIANSIFHAKLPPPLAGRINEASRFFEDRLLELINAHPDFSCTIPKTTEGKEQRSGYPDLRIQHLPSKTIAYLDPKLYEQKSHDSSFRTFYYEPTDRTSKITEDALHFLLGFAHDGETRAWTFTSWNLVDLSSLELTLKAEFHASNRDVYQEEKTIATSPKQVTPSE